MKNFKKMFLALLVISMHGSISAIVNREQMGQEVLVKGNIQFMKDHISNFVDLYCHYEGLREFMSRAVLKSRSEALQEVVKITENSDDSSKELKDSWVKLKSNENSYIRDRMLLDTARKIYLNERRNEVYCLNKRSEKIFKILFLAGFNGKDRVYPVERTAETYKAFLYSDLYAEKIERIKQQILGLKKPAALAVGIVGLAVGCKMFGKTILKYVAKNTAPALERLARGFEGARQRC